MNNVNITCKHCGHDKGLIKSKGIHFGLYCNKCLKWIKWLSSSEMDILLSQEKQIRDISIDNINITIKELEKQRDNINKQLNELYNMLKGKLL